MLKELRRVWSYFVVTGSLSESSWWVILGMGALAVVVPLGYLVWMVVS